MRVYGLGLGWGCPLEKPTLKGSVENQNSIQEPTNYPPVTRPQFYHLISEVHVYTGAVNIA